MSCQGCIDTAIARVAMQLYTVATVQSLVGGFDELHTICQFFPHQNFAL